MDNEIVKKLDSFFNQYKSLSLKKGKALYQPNDPIHSIYLLKQGLIKQYAISENGEVLTINVFRPNSFFPIMLILANQPNKYFFQAETDVLAFRAPTEEVMKFIIKNPDVLLDLTKRLSSAILGLSIRVEELSFNQASERISLLLLYLAERFGEKTKDSNLIIKLALTHQDLASWTSLTRETVSRQLEQLSKKGLISYNRHSITILDKDKLQDS